METSGKLTANNEPAIRLSLWVPLWATQAHDPHGAGQDEA